MELKNKKWLLLVSIPAIIGISLIIFLTISEISTNSSLHAPWKHKECPRMVPNYILWASIILLIFAVVPVSYYFISNEMEKKLEMNMKIISKMISGNGRAPKKGQKEISDKGIILKFLNPNERKVLEKLIADNGKTLQSKISQMEDMTKLKAHRAVKSLEIKGIIKKEAYGKTNRIILAKDIKDIILK